MKFLEQVATRLVKQHGHNMAGVLVLMPNHRSCTYLANTLQQMAEKTILAPHIVELQDYLLDQSPLTPADTIELVADLYSCYQAMEGPLTLDEFIGIAYVMLSDFDELDREMADARLFFKNLEMLQSMKTYEPGTEPSEYVQNYRRFWQQFGQLYKALRERLLQKGKGYKGMIMRQVAETLPGSINVQHYTAAYVVGFSGFTKTAEALVKSMDGLLPTHILWDADQYYVSDAMNEAGLSFRKEAPQWIKGQPEWLNEIATRPKAIEVIGVAKNMGQAKVAASVLQHHIPPAEASTPETVLVVPDEKLLAPLVAHLPPAITALNLTMGITIQGSLSASWVGVLFRVYENSRKYYSVSAGQRFYYRDVFELLQHNFFRLLFPEVNTEAFVDGMKKQNRILVRRDEITTRLGSKAAAMFFEGEETAGYAAFLSAHIQLLVGRILEEVKGGNTILAPEVEILYRLLGVVENTRTHFDGTGQFSIKTMIALLREHFRNERVPVEGEPVKGLQIMGLLETRALDFKNVIILSANEGILPTGKSNRTYIPFEMRNEFLTTYKHQEAVNAYLFYRLLHKAERVYLLYNTEPDELGGGEKSRYIVQLQHELPVGSNITLTDKVYAVDPPAAGGEPPVVVTKNGAVINKLYEILEGSGMSPSALNTYINCPLQYYLRYVAGVRQDDEMEESMEASTIGSAVHDTLEEIYKHKTGEVLTLDYVEARRSDTTAIEGLVSEKLKKRFDRESLSRGRNLLLYKVCVKLVSEFLKQEADNLRLIEDSGLEMKLVALEEKLEHGLLINGRQIKISGRTDRVEEVGGVVQIADYKTSARSTIPTLNEQTWEGLMSDPKYAKPVQLLVYAWLYYRQHGMGGQGIRSGIYWLRDQRKILDTLTVSKTDDVLGVEELQLFEEKLKTTLAELLNPEKPFEQTTDEQRCMYCEFVRICGRG